MKAGDRITVLSSINTELVPERGIVFNVTEYGDGQWRSLSDDKWRSLASARDEGIEWIHGHHRSESHEVAALRVAYALGKISAGAVCGAPYGVGNVSCERYAGHIFQHAGVGYQWP